MISRTLVSLFILICLGNISHGQKLKILPLGNSITYDFNASEPPYRDDAIRISYRFKLYELLNSAGYTWDYVGNFQCGSNYLPYSSIDSLDYTDNAGIPGITPEQLVTFLSTSHDPVNDVCWIGGCPRNYFEYAKPDVILLHIGTNALSSNADAVSHANAVNNILNLVDAYETSSGKTVTVFLALIINRASASGNPEHTFTSYYNSLLIDLYESRPTDKVVLVNMETDAGLNYRLVANGGDMLDTWHPAPSGYIKMANKWFSVMENYNIKAPSLKTLPDQSFTETQGSSSINLNPYIFDPQDPDNEIAWSTVGAPQYFDVTFQDGTATITPKNAEISAFETLTFKATDGGQGNVYLSASKSFSVSYTAVNDKPVVSSVTSGLSTAYQTPVNLSLNHVTVTDPDNIWPADFTLIINSGPNYTVSGNQVVPANGFAGVLHVSIAVNDGTENSESATIDITVNPLNGNNEIENNIMGIYPNPTHDKLQIEFKEPGNYEIDLIDYTGKTFVNQKFLNITEKTLDVHHLPAGIYFLKITSKDHRYLTKISIQ